MDVQGTLQKTAGVAGVIAATSIGGLKAAAAATGEKFAAHLSDAQAAAEVARKKSEKESRKAAEGLVAHALILPMLKQLRRSTFNQKGPFSPGNGEKAFGPEFDMQIADRIAQSPKMTLTATLTSRLQARHSAKATTRSSGVDVRG